MTIIMGCWQKAEEAVSAACRRVFATELFFFFSTVSLLLLNQIQTVGIITRMLRYRFPSCRSIRILMILMSGPEPWMLPGGLLPQEAERRCDFVGVDGVSVAGEDSLVGGDVSTSRQDTDGDLMCCEWNENEGADDYQ